jgi:MFS family permease
VTRAVATYLVSRVLAASGLTMLRASLMWHLYALTDSAFYLGLTGVVQFIPALVLALPAGVIADRFDRRRVTQLGQLIVAVLCVGVGVLTYAERADAVHLFVIAACVSAANAFSNPARAALLPTLVSRDAFPRVVTWASTAQALAFATGPALAGLVIATSTIGFAYGGAAVLLVASIVALAFLVVPERVEASGAVAKKAPMTWAAVFEGLRFVGKNKVVLGAMTLDLFAVILGGAGALLPVFANDVLHVGATGYGALSASLEVGAVAMSIVLIVLPPIRRAGRALFITVAIYGVATIVFGASTAFPLSLVAYGLAGAADQVSVVLRHTMVQLSTPDELRGRVSSVSSIFIGASNQLAAVEAGFVAAATSAPFAVVTGGAGVLLVVVVVAIALPELRRFTIESRAAPA